MLLGVSLLALLDEVRGMRHRRGYPKLFRYRLLLTFIISSRFGTSLEEFELGEELRAFLVVPIPHAEQPLDDVFHGESGLSLIG